MGKIRILQLSDIHNISCPQAMDHFKNMREGLIKDIKGYCDCYHCGFDAILICGDIAFGGTKEEYAKSKELAENICEAVGCEHFQVYVVPGNHDKVRNEGKPALRQLLNWGMTHLYASKKDDEKDVKKYDKIEEEGIKNNENANDESNMFRAFMEAEPHLFSNLYLPFRNYVEFSKDFFSVEPIMLKCIEESQNKDFHIDLNADEMFWKSKLYDDFQGYHVNLVGLNSALTCDENDWSPDDVESEGHKMLLSVFAHNNLNLNNDKSINILMMHHPLNYIVNGEELSKKFDDMFSLQFYGHVHMADSSQLKEGASVRVFSGAMQPPKGSTEEERKKYFPIYNIVEMEIPDEKARQLKVNLIVNKWNGSAFEPFKEQSKEYVVNLLYNSLNRWEQSATQKMDVLPDGVSEREIKCKFNDFANHKIIINKMYDGLYDNDLNDFKNCRAFLKKVGEDNRWVDLWSLVNS